MNRKIKFQKLLKVLTPDNTLPDFTAFDAQIEELKGKLKDKIIVKTLEEVNSKLESFKQRIDLQPLKDSLLEIEVAFQEQVQNLYAELETKALELSTADETRSKALGLEMSTLQGQITDLETSFKEDIKKIKKSIPDLTDLNDRVSELTLELGSRITTLEDEEPQEIKDWTDTIEKLRKELLNRINNIGGGSMNRHINFGGVDYLTKYTDINYKAGTNITFTVVSNNATKMVDVTITASGSGGSVRSINSISTSQTAGATAGTDYVYLCSSTMTLTMPTAVGNTNLYTIKNVGSGIITVAFNGVETGDGQTTLVMPVQYTSIDLISDTVNFNIT